jgi:hypothetical protein
MTEDDYNALASQLQQVQAEVAQLALQLQQVEAELARVLVLAPSDADELGDQLVTVKEGAAAVHSTAPTVWRWQAQHPEVLGVKRVGGKIFISLRKLRVFANRRST